MARTTERYVPDHVSLAAFLMSGQLNRPVRQVSKRIRIGAAAKVRKKSGTTARSYRVKAGVAAGPPDGTLRWAGGPRRVNYVTSNEGTAIILEFGRGKRPGRGGNAIKPDRPLRSAGAPFHSPLRAEKLV